MSDICGMYSNGHSCSKKWFISKCISKTQAGCPELIVRHEKANKKSPKFWDFFGGEKGIRTLDTVPRIHDFQSCALDQLSHLSTAICSIRYAFSAHLNIIH